MEEGKLIFKGIAAKNKLVLILVIQKRKVKKSNTWHDYPWRWCGLVSVVVLFSGGSVSEVPVANFKNSNHPCWNDNTQSGFICNAAVITIKTQAVNIVRACWSLRVYFSLVRSISAARWLTAMTKLLQSKRSMGFCIEPCWFPSANHITLFYILQNTFCA